MSSSQRSRRLSAARSGAEGGRGGPRRRLARALAAALLLLACAGSTAQALPSPALYRVQQLCSTPRPGRASCMGLRLIARSETNAQLSARSRRENGELAAGISPAVSSKSLPGGLTPAALHAAYQLPGETPAALGQTIGIVDAYNDPTAEADLAVYDKQFGLPECTTANGCFRKLNQAGKSSPLPATNGQWSTEISLDVQMAHAICDSCRIVLVEATSETWGSLGAAVNAAVAAGASEVSNSYGGPEFPGDSELSAAYYDHPGVVVTVSSGDCGYYNQACGGAAAANFPAAAAHVVAVGGTSLRASGEAWSSTVWSGGGSGCSQLFTAALWQSAAAGFPAAGCAGGRSVADVGAVADPYTGVDVYDSTPAGGGEPTGWGVWGGTSAASPIVAGEFALGGGARGVAYPAATLYSHLGQASSLYDVVAGANGSCAGTTACRAVPGFDGPTGVGSPVGLGAFVVAGSPAETSAPTLSGAAEENQTLSAGPGSWSPGASAYTYQWALCNSAGALCAAITGATARTLTLTAGDIGHTVRVVVTGSNAAGSGTAVESAASAVVASDEPKLTAFTPASAITGSTVTITGSALRGTTRVSFGTLPASFTVDSAGELTAVIPNGASAGTISLTTPFGTASSGSRFSPSLSIAGESPGRASAGTFVTITGVGFTSSSLVRFNGLIAPGASISPGTIRVKVPAGAKTGPITVTNTAAPVGTVQSAGSFVVA